MQIPLPSTRPGPLHALALLPLWSATPSAQALVGEAHQIPFPPPMSAGGSSTRTVVGHLSGDLRADVVVLHEGSAIVFGSPETYSWWAPLGAGQPTSVLHDMDVVPGLAEGGRDLLLTCGAAGVLAWTYDGPSQQFTGDALDLGPSAQGSRALRAAPQGDGFRVIYADASGSALHGCSFDAQGALLHSWSLALSESVEQIELGQWVADAEPEIYVRSASQVRVLAADGTAIESFSTTGSFALLAPFRDIESSIDSLGVVEEHAGAQWFRELRPGASSSFGFGLGPLDIAALEALDLDGDGADDLVFFPRFTSVGWTSLNQGHLQAQSFSLDSAQCVPFTHTAPGLDPGLFHADVATADLDEDGDEELVYACDAEAVLKVFRGSWAAETWTRPSVLSLPTDWIDGQVTSRNAGVRMPIAPMPASTHMQVQLYRHDAQGQIPLAPEIEHLVDIGGLGPGWSVPMPDLVFALESTPAFSTVYTVVTRLVRREGGVTVAASTSNRQDVDGLNFQPCPTCGITGINPRPVLPPSGTSGLPSLP